MEEIKREKMGQIAPFFDGWEESLIWSCLQGHMGRAWADCAERPQAAQIVVGDFCFLAGDCTCPGAKELAGHIPEEFSSEILLMIPKKEGWNQLIEEQHGSRQTMITRYAVKKEPGVFDVDRLTKAARQVPEGCSLVFIDQALYGEILQQEWCRDLCAQFPSAQDYVQRGLGVAALCDGQIVSGASSYTVYDSGIEIEVDTREDFRRRGLALCCASTLILECLRRGWYPSWDAANLASVALAEKLGYHRGEAYPAYAVKRKDAAQAPCAKG